MMGGRAGQGAQHAPAPSAVRARPAAGAQRPPAHQATTLAMDAQTWAMFLLLSAATHMRPVSVP